MKISFFKSLPSKGNPHLCDEIINLDELLSKIKFGEWKNQVEVIRSETDKVKRNKLKLNLPTVTIGGTFKERSSDNLIEHSGFICVDIDNYNDKSSLLSDPYTYALFNSASGNGIAIIVKVNKDKHKESYRWLSNYYFLNFGISVDPAPSNVASLRFVSYDPDLFVNARSLQSKTKTLKEKRIQSSPIVLGTDQVDEMMRELSNSGKNIVEDYYDWLRIGFAIANGFGEGGRNYYHNVSMASSKYNSQQCDKQYDRCLQGANKSGTTVGTLYYYLKENGIDLPKSNERAVQLVAMAKKSGRTVEGAATQLEQMNGMSKSDALKIANEVFERKDIDLNKVANDPEELIQSLIQWLSMNHPMRINSITKKIEETGTDLTEAKRNTIYLRARITFNSKEVTKQLVDSIIFSDFITEYNPITEYIDKNRHRNSTGNIEKVIESIKTNTPNSDVFIKKWLVSIIAAYDGFPVRSVLALVGGQNTGKTEWFRRLLPSKLTKYYAESKLDNGKDDEILMTEKLIVMDDEMGGKSKQDEKRFKELTSKQTFSLRAAYGRHNEDYKRLSILCGTSNDPNIINDPTGNTRILPIDVISINHELYNSIDKDELFMELLRSYEGGYEWRLNKDEMSDLNLVSQNFETIAFERELILQFFTAEGNAFGYTEFLTSTEIKDVIETNTRQRIMNSRKFQFELKSIFGEKVSIRRHGLPSKCYKVIRIGALPTTSQLADNEEPPF